MKRVIIFLVCVASLFSGTTADTFFEVLEKKFNEYNRAFPPRSMEFIFNQPSYAPGDTIYFHVSLRVGDDSLVKDRELITTTFSDPSGKPVSKNRFVVKNGMAEQYLILPTDLLPGVYQFCGNTDLSANRQLLSTQIIVAKNKMLAGEDSKATLPATPHDFTLDVDMDAESFRATVHIPKGSKFESKPIHLVVTSLHELKFKSTVTIGKEDQASISIPRNQLGPNTAQLSIFDSEFNNLATKLLFNRISQPVVSLVGLKESYRNREKVDFVIEAKNNRGESILQSYVVSVTKADLFPPQNQDPQQTPDERWTQQVLSLKTNLVDWNSVLTKNESAGPSLNADLEINGRLVFKDSGSPVPDSTKISGILKNDLIAYEAYTTTNGYFKFRFLYDFIGDDELFYIISKGNEEYHNVRMELFADQLPVCVPKQNYSETETVNPYYSYWEMKSQVDRAFKVRRTSRKQVDWNSKFEDELMGADRETNLDKYQLMPTMEEVIKEIVPALHVRKEHGQTVVRVLLRSDDKIPPVSIDEPLYCIDGELTKNSAYFLSLLPTEVARIKLIVEKEKLERFDVLGRNGIVIVQTKRTKPESIPDNTTIRVLGVTKPMLAHFPDYTSINNRRKPDFRSNLFFKSFYQDQPNLSQSNSFFTSDDVGDYIIRINGRVKDGTAFYAEQRMKVSF